MVNVSVELVDHLSDRLGLERRQAARVIEEVLAYYREPAQAFVRRRHRGLQHQGHHNPHIFARIREELDWHRFPAPELSLRQLRRWVYG